jgi:hypothetical protein
MGIIMLIKGSPQELARSWPITIKRVFHIDILFRFSREGPDMAARMPKLEVAAKFREALMARYPTRIKSTFTGKGRALVLKNSRTYPPKMTYLRITSQERYLPHRILTPWIMPPDTLQTKRSTMRPTMSIVPMSAAPMSNFSVIKIYRKLPIIVEAIKVANEYSEYLNISVFVTFRVSFCGSLIYFLLERLCL